MARGKGSDALISGSFAAALLVIVLVGRFVPEVRREVDCIGDPISVGQPYKGDKIAAHSCLPQCRDRKPRYLVYANGVATQCEAPPGCSDQGEDTGETCRPPRPETTP